MDLASDSELIHYTTLMPVPGPTKRQREPVKTSVSSDDRVGFWELFLPSLRDSTVGHSLPRASAPG